MSNERTGVDRVLDWVVPIRLSGKWMSVEVERGVKILICLMSLAVIPVHAVNKTLEVLPPDAADSMVWTKFSLYLLCDIVVYAGIIVGVLLLKPFVLELMDAIEKAINDKAKNDESASLVRKVVPIVTLEPTEVPLPISSNPAERISEPESEIPTSIVKEPEPSKTNTYFSKAINELSTLI